jgi:hypothetical protein
MGNQTNIQAAGHGLGQLFEVSVMLLQSDVEILGTPDLGPGERVMIDGRPYTVIRCDKFDLSVGSTNQWQGGAIPFLAGNPSAVWMVA